MTGKEIKKRKNEFLVFLAERIPDWLMPPESFFNSFNTGLKTFARQRGIIVSNILEIDDLSQLNELLNALQHNDNYVYTVHSRKSKRIEGLKYYIDFLKKINNKLITQNHVNSRENTITELEDFVEGQEAEEYVIMRERSLKAREWCVAKYGAKCYVCGFDFEKKYGELGKGFIEVHHIVPISQRGGAYRLNPITDLIPVCSNCHSMIHRKKETTSIDKLKQIINDKSKQ